MPGSTVRANIPSRMTVEEFIAWPGDGWPFLHQLIDGEPVAMSPPSEAHGTIQANLTYLLAEHLRRRPPGCRVVVTPGVVPRVRSSHNCRVPDLAVTCAPPDRGRHMLDDPVLVIEVLSPSNEAETREAVWAYTTIPSVTEILLVRSTAVAAELWRRGPEGVWPPEPTLLGSGDELVLEGIGFAAPLAEFYANTTLAAPAVVLR